MHKHLRCQTLTSRPIGNKGLFRELSKPARVPRARFLLVGWFAWAQSRGPQRARAPAPTHCAGVDRANGGSGDSPSPDLIQLCPSDRWFPWIRANEGLTARTLPTNAVACAPDFQQPSRRAGESDGTALPL